MESEGRKKIICHFPFVISHSRIDAVRTLPREMAKWQMMNGK